MKGSISDSPQVDLAGMMEVLADQADVAAAYLYGSVARDQANRLSDVDVAVLFEPEPDGEALVQRQLELMAALQSFADREVQVIALNSAPPLLAYQVLRDGRFLCQRNAMARVAFEVRIMKRYFDLQPMIAAYDEQLARRIQEVGLGASRRCHTRALSAAERIRERLAGVAER